MQDNKYTGKSCKGGLLVLSLTPATCLLVENVCAPLQKKGEGKCICLLISGKTKLVPVSLLYVR